MLQVNLSGCFIFFHICCKCICGCCIYLQWFLSVFQVFQMYVLSVSSAFRRMLLALYLNVLKIDQGVRHGMCVGSGRRHERSPRECAARPMSERRASGDSLARAWSADAREMNRTGVGAPAVPISISSQPTVRQTHSPSLLNSLHLGACEAVCTLTRWLGGAAVPHVRSLAWGDGAAEPRACPHDTAVCLTHALAATGTMMRPAFVFA